jgi:glucokinase
MRMRHAIGVDVGGSFVKLVAVEPDGRVIHRARMATDTSSPASLPDAIARALDEVRSTHGPAVAVGLASPGLVRRGDNHVHWMQGRLDVVQGLDWTAALRRDSAVSVLNDAQAALLGEVWLGAGRGCRDVVLLTVGTGVGGAILADGRLLAGHTGRAGHLGHITVDAAGSPDIVGTPGSLEDAIGDCTVARRSHGRFATTEELVAAHVGGDEDATRVWQTSVRHLAAAVASIVNAVDPARVILGGGIATRAGDVLMMPLRRGLDDFEWRPHGAAVEVVLAELGDEAGAIGAARHAMSH